MAHTIGTRLAHAAAKPGSEAQTPGECVLILTSDYRIRAANQATLDLLGYTPDALVGKRIAAILGGPFKRGPRTAPLPSVLGAANPVELTLYAKDERPVQVLFHSTSVTLDTKDTLVLCFVQPKVSQTIKEWTAIQADMLRQSQEQFMANMSHEMRTPLTGILGMAQIMETTKLSGEQQEQLETILQCGRDLLGFVDRVLDFKEARHVLTELHPEDFGLMDMVHELLDRYEPSLSAKNLHCTVHADSDVPNAVRGDREKLERVLDVLLDNAIKFTDHGEIRLRIVREASEGDLLRLRLSLRDSGVGIPPSKQELIFEPFQQGDGSLTRPYGGGGLGLSLARELIRALKGELWVDSDPGWGSEFHVALPLINLRRSITDREIVDNL